MSGADQRRGRLGARRRVDGAANPPPRRASAFDSPARPRRRSSRLDALGQKGSWEVGGRELRLTNLDKVLFPGRDGEDPLTKRDLIRYHATWRRSCCRTSWIGRSTSTDSRTASTAPGSGTRRRPPTPPNGSRGGTTPTQIRERRRRTPWPTRPPRSAWLANFGAVELHPWTTRVEDHLRPTYALFDVDPGTETTWDEVLALGRLHRTALEHLGVRGFPKVTGRRGMQIWVPIVPRYSFAETAPGSRPCRGRSAHVVPELVSWRWEKAGRGGRARLDYTQNAINRTLVVPYGVRASPGAPVSAPITWEELDDPDLRPDRWTIRTILERVLEVGDLYGDLASATQELPDLGLAPA